MEFIWTHRNTLGPDFDVQCAPDGPKFLVRRYRHHDKTEFFLFRNSQTRAIELRSESEVEKTVEGWTAQILGWPRFDVIRHNHYGQTPPAWMETHWSKDAADDARTRLLKWHPGYAVVIRVVPVEVYSKA